MAKIITKLNLNKTPQLVENNSMIFAKNIKLLKDTSIGPDSSFDKIFDSYQDGKSEYELRKGYVGHIVGVNNTVYFFLDVDHTDNNANVKIYKYNEEENDGLYLVECGWKYSGGKITGCTTINNTNEEILTICEYFDESEHINVPIKHINIQKATSSDNETIYTQHPDLPISNLFQIGKYTCNIPNGVYQFFIRYKIRKDFYTPWIPCSKECYAGTQEVTNTIQGQIRNINLHRDSANSFIFKLHHCFTDVDWYESCQLGFILSHDDSVVARSWKHFNLEQDLEIYFDYDKNSIEEINIDDLTRTNFELFNVKNVCYYKAKEYIANYEETDFNPDLQDIADNITCDLEFAELDNSNKIELETKDGIIEIDYPDNGYISDPIIISDLIQNNIIQIDEVQSEEDSEHSIDPVWKVKARNHYNVGDLPYTNYLVWWLSKGEPKINYTDEDGTSYNTKYEFSYYNSDNELNQDNLQTQLELLKNSGDVYTTFDTQQAAQSHADNQHKLAENLGNHVDNMWYWAVGDNDEGEDHSYGTERLNYIFHECGGSGNYYDHLVDPVYGTNDQEGFLMLNKDVSRAAATGDIWFSIGNLYRSFGSYQYGGDSRSQRIRIGDKLLVQKNPFTGLNGVETWKKQLKYMLELNYPTTMIKRAYFMLSGETEAINILGDDTWGVDNEDNLHGKKVSSIEDYIDSFRAIILSRVVAIDIFGNCYAKVDLNGGLTPDNVKVITQFGVEYVSIEYSTDASTINHLNDLEDTNNSDPANVCTIDFTVSAKYTECSKAYTIKYKGHINEVNHDYDYPTLMPFTGYEFYIHFVKQSGIATNGYKIHSGIDNTLFMYDSYDTLGIIYPKFHNIALPDSGEYTSVFFSYAKVKNNIAKCFNHNFKDGYHYVDCLECDLLLYNLDKNITIFGSRYPDLFLTEQAEYHSSGSNKYLPLFGNCGIIRWKDQMNVDSLSNIDLSILTEDVEYICYAEDTNTTYVIAKTNGVLESEPLINYNDDGCFIYIKNDAINNEYKKLVKLTPYLLKDSDQADYTDDNPPVPIHPDENNIPEYVHNLNSPAHICSIKKLSHESDVYYVTGNDVYNKQATGSEITVDMNSSLLANIPSRTFYLPSNFNINYVNLSSDITPQIRKPSDDTNIDIIKQIISYTQSLIASSVSEHPSMYRDYMRKYYVPYEDEHIIKFDNTIRSSNVNVDEAYRHIYTFDSEDYYNVPTNRGIIVNLFNLSDFIYVHCQHALFKFAGVNSLHSDEGKVELKEGDVFDTGIKEVFDSQFGHAGLMKKEHCCITFTAYFFYDAYSKIIYAYGGETQLANISDHIRKLLDDYKQDTIKFVADENNDRVFINLVKNKNKKVLIHTCGIDKKGITFNYVKPYNEYGTLTSDKFYSFEDLKHFLYDYYLEVPEVYNVLFTPDTYNDGIEDLVNIIKTYINSNQTIEEFVNVYNDLWNNYYSITNSHIWSLYSMLINYEYNTQKETYNYAQLDINKAVIDREVLIKDSSNICLSYNFKNKGYISIHDFDFIEGFGTRMFTYFANQKDLPLGYIENNNFVAKYGWEINRINRDIVKYTCYNGAYKPSDIGLPEVDDFTEPVDRNIINVEDTLEAQLDQDNSQIVPSVIDIINVGEYEKIKNLEYVNWIASLIDEYGKGVVNYAEEVLNRNYSATKLRIYSDQCYTDLIQVVDAHNNHIRANDANISDFKQQKYPRYNCGIWSLNYFRDIKNNNDAYNYNTNASLRGRNPNYKYVQEDSLIYGKYFVLRLIYWNKNFKLENVEFKVNNYGKIS